MRTAWVPTVTVKSVQTGYASSSSLSAGAGEDAKYLDVTVTSVDATKSVVAFQGGAGALTGDARRKSGATDAYECTVRLTSATNLRIAISSATPVALAGRWTIVEYY